MIVETFSKSSGISVVSESNLVTQAHSHPALEIIIAHDGLFDLKIESELFKNTTFGIIPPNQNHLLNANKCVCTIITVDSGLLDCALISKEILTLIKTENNYDSELKSIILSIIKTCPKRSYSDPRIMNIIELIHNWNGEQHLTRSKIARSIHLSESRTSHVFKDQVGVSISEYIAWHRLGLAIKILLEGNIHLTQAALMAGFYDVANFSNTFKTMLGLNPSRIYNSSTIVQN